jgi:hypothetical protein
VIIASYKQHIGSFLPNLFDWLCTPPKFTRVYGADIVMGINCDWIVGSAQEKCEGAEEAGSLKSAGCGSLVQLWQGWQSDSGYQLAELGILMDGLEGACGGECRELQVVALVGDLEILQGVGFLPEGDAGCRYFKG